MAGKTLTAEERAERRRNRTRQRRTATYVELMSQPQSPTVRLAHACAYLRAVADDLDDDAVAALTADVVRLAEKGNQP